VIKNTENRRWAGHVACIGETLIIMGLLYSVRRNSVLICSSDYGITSTPNLINFRPPILQLLNSTDGQKLKKVG
jgi:hypothetical protein